MKITLDKEEKLELIHTLMCTNHDYFRENYLLLSWDDEEYKKCQTKTDECYEDTLLNMLKKGYDIILKDNYEDYEDGERPIEARLNLKEMFINLDNVYDAKIDTRTGESCMIDDNFYSSIDQFTSDVLAVLLHLNWDSVTMTRISSVLFYHNEKTRK